MWGGWRSGKRGGCSRIFLINIFLYLFDKLIDVIERGPDGGGLELVAAAEYIRRRFLERASPGNHFPEFFQVIIQIRAHVAAEDNIAVIVHPQIIDGNGQVVQILMKGRSIGLLAFFDIIEKGPAGIFPLQFITVQKKVNRLEPIFKEMSVLW